MKKKIISSILVIMLITLAFAGCGTGSSDAPPASNASQPAGDSAAAEPAGEARFQSRTINFLSIWDDTDPTQDSYMILDISRQYGETVDNFEILHEFVGIENIDQRISILAASNDLPEIATYESGSRLKALIETGQILNVEETWKELGIYEYLDDGAASLLKNLVDNVGLYAAPLGLNMEGFWYHKELFAQAGITDTPKTWDEFMDVCQKLKDAGIAPIAQGGKDQWPVTRVLNAYAVRSIGNDAITDAMLGKASFTDPEYVAAAQMFADMAANEYFIVGMTTIDHGTSIAMLMNGQSAMLYNGSWVTGNLNSDENAAGPEGIGFFNVPTAGGASGPNDYSMNCGNILVFSADKYDEAVADWMKYVFPRIGDHAMNNNGTFKGYKINDMPEETSYYTQIVANALSGAENAFLWFEAKMDNETSALAQNNITLLYSGEMSPEAYMAMLQESAEKNRA